MARTATKLKKHVVIGPTMTPTTVRFETRLKEALARAAKDQRRSSAAMLHIILEEWLTAHKYL